MNGIFIISAPKSLTRVFFKYGKSSNFNVKIKGICESRVV
jgi:hypothetical protein